MALTIRLLGTFEVVRDGHLVGPGPEAVKPRTLLALLAIHANQVLAKGLIAERVWADPPATARNLVEKYVSLWRKVLEPDRLETVGRGYRLRAGPDEIDLGVHRRQLDQGRALIASGQAAAAADVLDSARKMWHGWDVRSFAEELLPNAEAHLIVDLHLRGMEDWAQAALTAGLDGVAEPVLQALERNPYRERLAELLMWAYARDGDTAEASDVYQRTRERLAHDLGQDPGDGLRRMHAQVVRRDTVLNKRRSPQPVPISNLAPGWQQFTGRAGELALLDELLVAPAAGAHVHGVTICGGVGVGKTALAMEFARRHAAEYDLIWVVNGPTRNAILDSLEELAERLGCPLPAGRDADLTALWNQFERRRRWLIVLDNAGGPAALQDLWPPRSNGTLIVTTLDPDWGRSLRMLELGVLSRAETIALLRSRGADGSDECLDELAAELDGLPLACEQAAAFLRQTSIGARNYLALFRARHRELLARGAPDDHSGTIEATWRLALAQLYSAPAAIQLAMLCAALAPEDIPLGLIAADTNSLPQPLAEAVADRLTLEDTIRELRRFSLITREGDRLRMHRLVQAVLIGFEGTAEAGLWQARVTRLVIASAPKTTSESELWPVWQYLVPHVLLLADRFDGGPALQPELVDLLQRASDYLVARGSFNDALSLLERTLAIIGSSAEPQNVELGHTWMQLGDLLFKVGRPRDAIDAHENALSILRQHYPGDHPAVARSVAGLTTALTCHHGVSLWKESDLATAQQRFITVLGILRQSLGSADPVVANALSGLGQVLQDRGDLDGGVACQQSALETLIAAYGHDHPDVGHVYGKLGFALALRHDFARAQECQQASLRILTEAFGAGDPETGWPLSNLGVLFLESGDAEQAASYQRRARRIFEADPGHELAKHITGWRLARAYLGAARADDALAILTETVPALEAALGDGHADLIMARNDLAQARRSAGPETAAAAVRSGWVADSPQQS